jgi:hypothetical protein
MTDRLYPAPHPESIDDLDPETATTDRLIAMVRRHREDRDDLDAETLLANLPVVLRALCDHLMSGEATALDVAYRIASIIDAVETIQGSPVPPHRRH